MCPFQLAIKYPHQSLNQIPESSILYTRNRAYFSISSGEAKNPNLILSHKKGLGIVSDAASFQACSPFLKYD